MTVNDDLMQILKFTEEELVINRAGDVSVRQLEQLKQDTEKANNRIVALMLFGLLLFGYGLCSSLFISDSSQLDADILDQRRASPVMWLVLATVVLGVGVFLVKNNSNRLSRDRAELIVNKIDSPIRLKRTRRRYGDWYDLLLARYKIHISQNHYEQLQALCSRDGENVVYRWYVLKYSGLLLSVERLESETSS